MESKLRGSDALLEAYRAGGISIDADLVEGLAKRIGDRQLHDILIKGQPHPDFLRTSFAVGGAGDAGGLVAELLEHLTREHKLPAVVRVFPRGIPWPEEFMVDVTIAEQGF